MSHAFLSNVLDYFKPLLNMTDEPHFWEIVISLIIMTLIVATVGMYAHEANAKKEESELQKKIRTIVNEELRRAAEEVEFHSKNKK